MQHLNLSHAAASEMRVSHPKLVETLARKALQNVPRTTQLLEKHFSKAEKVPPRPPPIKPQKLYSGWGTV
jgi:hypothetical protein